MCDYPIPYRFPGFVLEGFDIEHSSESVEAVIQAVTTLLPPEKPRFIHGLHTPGMYDIVHILAFSSHNSDLTSGLADHELYFRAVMFYSAGEIFTAVEGGVDVFDGSYPYTITERGCALTFPHQLPVHHTQEAGGVARRTEPRPFQIDLKDEK